MNNLLAQNKELKRLRKEAERRKAEDEEEREAVEAEGRVREVDEFERGLSGVAGKVGGKTVGSRNGKVEVQEQVESGPKGVKRKLEGDTEELTEQANGDAHKSKRHASDQHGRADEGSFWVPSKTPDNKKADIKAIKHNPTCPAGAADKPHDFSLKTLIPVNFTEDNPPGEGAAPTRTCPSCNKALSNSTKAVLSRACGHVLCKPCSDKFQTPERDEMVRCYICGADVSSRKKQKREDKKAEESAESGLVQLSSEGTGFAGGGKNMVKKEGTAFQC